MLSLCGFFRFLEEHCNSRDVSKMPKSIVIPKSTYSCLPVYFIYKWESMIEIKLIAMNYSYLTCTVSFALYLLTHYSLPCFKKDLSVYLWSSHFSRSWGLRPSTLTPQSIINH